MRVALLTDRINNKLEKSNLINEHSTCPFESIRKPEKGCVFQECTRSVPATTPQALIALKTIVFE